MALQLIGSRLIQMQSRLISNTNFPPSNAILHRNSFLVVW